MKSPQLQRWFSPSRLWQRLRHIHVENKGLKMMALLLAILLFALSRQPISDVKIFNVPLEFRGQRADVEISGEIAQTVSVRVRGPRDLVRSLTPNQLSVIADLTNKEAGERLVQLHPDDVSLPDNNIRVIQVDPASIRLILEPKAKKLVAVEAQFMGQLPERLEIYRTGVEPSTVEIEGAQSQLARVSRVLTETVNLDGRDRSFQTFVDVDVPHTSLRVLTPSPIKLNVEIGERRSFKRISNVPLVAASQPLSGRLLIKTVDVEVYGPNSAVDALQAKDLRAEAVAVPSGNLDTAEIKVILPANTDTRIEVRSITPKEVKLKK